MAVMSAVTHASKTILGATRFAASSLGKLAIMKHSYNFTKIVAEFFANVCPIRIIIPKKTYIVAHSLFI